MKTKLLILFGAFILWPRTTQALGTVGTPNAFMVENTTGTNNCYLVKTTPSCSATFTGLTVSTASFNGILNQSTLQAGASFYVTSGSATIMNSGQYNLNSPGGNWQMDTVGGWFSIFDNTPGNNPLQIQPAGTIFFARQMDGGGHLFNNLGSAYLGSSSINAASILQADSTTQGFLEPRMTTTQKNAIAAPPAGLSVYDTTLNTPFFYNGTAWTTVDVCSGTVIQTQFASVSASSITMVSASFVPTNLSVSITPTYTTSKIIAHFSAVINPGTDTMKLTILRGASNLLGANGFGQLVNTISNINIASGLWIDGPATTSATSYSVGMEATAASVTFCPTGTCTLMVQELCQQ